MNKMSAVIMQVIATVMLIGFIFLINITFIIAIILVIKALNRDRE